MNKSKSKDLVKELEKKGVKFFNKKRIDIRGSLKCGSNVKIDINNIFVGDVFIGDGVKIGANCIIKNSKIMNNSHIKDFTLIEESEIGESCVIGPYARLRPKAIIKKSVQIGNFVEIKNSIIGDNSRINHLTFIGDSFLESNVTFGAGCITCNHDGIGHNSLTVREGAYIGSGCNLISPIEIGAQATIGSGSTITEDVPPNTLTVCRTQKQTVIKNWSGPKKNG